MEVAVLNKSGKETGRKVVLSEEIFGIEPNDHAIYLDVKLYLAHQRQGTHKSKEKAEITGSTKKLKRQKGTGTARAGSIKSGVLRGGGRMFGPKPRNYGFKLNRKVSALARKSALTYKLKEEKVSVVEPVAFDSPKTKEFVGILNGLELNNTKTLFVLPDTDNNFFLSGRNVPKTKIVRVSDLNTYDVLNADKLVLIEDSVNKIQELLG